MELLLAITEDSATLRSDMSAVCGVGGESDATDIALFFAALHHPASLSLENHKAINLRSGQSPVSRRLLLVQALTLSHGLLTINEDRVCVIDDSVTDCVSQNGVGQFVAPTGNVKLVMCIRADHSCGKAAYFNARTPIR